MGASTIEICPILKYCLTNYEKEINKFETNFYPKLDILNLDEEKEKLIKNKIGAINFKDLFMESLSTEFLKLFKKNKHLFYAQSFLEGICKEYGLMGKLENIKEAYEIYKNGADNEYDYLCMYRLHRIFLEDYEKFGLEKNYELDRLYLYKCYAYAPYSIMDGTYYIFNKINITHELIIYFDYLDNSNLTTFNEFFVFINNNRDIFNVTYNDIYLMECVILSMFNPEAKNDISFLDKFLEIKKRNENDKAYYESRLKYCNFYIEFSGEKCDKDKVNNIFDKLINSEYYKALYDYAKFLINEGKFDDAKNKLKLGTDKSQQFCLGEYIFILLQSYNLEQLLSDYKIITYFFDHFCLEICLEKLSLSSFYYAFYYLTKHSFFKENIKKDYNKYAFEIYKIYEKFEEINNNDVLLNIFSEKYQIWTYENLGKIYYYGIFGLLESNKDKALIYFKKVYKLAKEKNYIYIMRINYLFAYKSRKHLYKKNRLTLTKLNKTKGKLFQIYEKTVEKNLSSIELYNYYKLYKFGVIGNTFEKKLRLLKEGKNIKIIYNFTEFIYKEKCKFALQCEYSTTFYNQIHLPLKNEFLENKNNICLIFKTTEGGQYQIYVQKDIQFIKVTHILFNIYPELCGKNIGNYVCNGEKVGIYKTVSENKLENGSNILIMITPKNNNNDNKLNDNTDNGNNKIDINNNNELLNENEQQIENQLDNNNINNDINEGEQEQVQEEQEENNSNEYNNAEMNEYNNQNQINNNNSLMESESNQENNNEQNYSNEYSNNAEMNEYNNQNQINNNIETENDMNQENYSEQNYNNEDNNVEENYNNNYINDKTSEYDNYGNSNYEIINDVEIIKDNNSNCIIF